MLYSCRIFIKCIHAFCFKLYTIIKRLEIRKFIKYKKKHSKNYKYHLVNLLSRPPNEKINVLKKGGILYYKDLDTFNTLCDNDMIEYKKPVHIEPIDLIKILNKDIILSQKIDGELKKNIDIELLYPKTNDYENVILDAEYIKELDLYLIFNQRSYFKQYDTYFDDFLEIRENHSYFKKNTKLDDFIINFIDNDIIKSKIEKEFSLIFDFCKNNKYKSKWIPKQFYKINNEINTIDLLKLFTLYQENIYI